MFGAVVRALLVIVAGSLLAVTLGFVGGTMLDTQEDVAGNQTANYGWGDAVVTWLPGIVIATIAIILIGSAVARRQRVV